MSISYKLLIICFLSGCQLNEGLKPKDTIFICPDSSDILEASRICSKVEIIPLETNERCLIAKVSKIMIGPKHLIIVDQFQSKILFFTKEGRFDFEIDKQGNGPGEYTQIATVQYDKKKDCVVIHDQNLGRFLFYSCQDGKFKGYDPVPYVFEDFFLQDGYYWLYSPHVLNINPSDNSEIPYGLFEVNDRGKFKRSLLTIGGPEDEILGFNSIQNLCQQNGCYLMPSFSDSIYEISEKGCHVAFVLDFGKYNLPDGLLYQDYTKSDNVIRLLQSNYVHSKIFFLNSEAFNYGIYIIKQRGRAYIYHKETAHVSLADCFIDDFNKLILPLPTAASKGALYGILDPNEGGSSFLDEIGKYYPNQEDQIAQYVMNTRFLLKNQETNPMLFKMNIIPN